LAIRARLEPLITRDLPLLGRHREHDRLDVLHALGSAFICFSALVFTPGNIFRIPPAGHLLDLAHVLRKSLRSIPLADLFLESVRLCLIERTPGLLDKRDDIALCRMRPAILSGINSSARRIFSYSDVLDGLFCHAVDRERRSAPGIAVHLGQHYNSDIERLVKALRDLNSVLPVIPSATRRISDGRSASLRRESSSSSLRRFAGGRGIDDQTDHAHAGLPDTRARDLHHVVLCPVDVNGNRELAAQRLQLVDRRGPVDVGRTSRVERPSAFSFLASLAAVVVLPDP